MNELRDYINSLIPKNLSARKKRLIYDELEAHLFDKTAYYKNLGYSLEEAIRLSKEDFGDSEIVAEICGEFETLYVERTRWSVAAASLILVMN